MLHQKGKAFGPISYGFSLEVQQEFKSELIQHIGAIMVFIGWFVTSIVSWRKGKIGLIKSAVVILLGILGIVAYGFMIYLN